MVIYDLKLYDMKTDMTTIVAVLPERRKDYDRPRGRSTIERLVKSLLGEDWWLQNWHNIVIAQRDYLEHYGEHHRGTKREAIQPPKSGGVTEGGALIIYSNKFFKQKEVKVSKKQRAIMSG